MAVSSEDTVIGLASTRPTGPGTLELDDLFVEPDRMRQGIARALLARLSAEAATEGAARIEVTANEHALEFYRAVGFVEDGRADTEFGLGLRMHLDVGPA